jgi:Family of unknown function (DUF5763)
MQCKGTTKSGSRCTRKGNNYCFQHTPKDEIKEEVKTETTLIKDLEQLSHQYLDPYTYVKLIAADPKLFDLKTYEKILANYEKIFPLIQYNQIHDEAVKFVEYLQPKILNGKQKIGPVYVASIITTLISENGENLGSIWDIEDIIYDKVKNTITSHLEYIRSEYLEMINHFDHSDLIEVLEAMEEKSRDLVFQAFEILKTLDPDVYDTDHPMSYQQKLEPIIIDLIDYKK